MLGIMRRILEPTELHPGSGKSISSPEHASETIRESPCQYSEDVVGLERASLGNIPCFACEIVHKATLKSEIRMK